jgi:hypothetical protein
VIRKNYVKVIDKSVILKDSEGKEYFGDRVSYLNPNNVSDRYQTCLLNGKRPIFGGCRYVRTDEDDYRNEETYENEDLGNEEVDFEVLLPEERFEQNAINEIQNELQQKLTMQQLSLWNQFNDERKKDEGKEQGGSLTRNLTYFLNKNELDKIKSILHQIISDLKLKEINKDFAAGKEEVLSIANNFRIIDLTPYNAVRFIRDEKDRIIPYFDEDWGKLQHPEAEPVLDLSCGKFRLRIDD